MPNVPAGAKAPADRKKPAAQLDAEGVETAEVVWRDHTFTVVADPDDWPVEASLAFEEGKATVGVRAMLGDKQWAELMRMKPRNRDLADLFNEIAKSLGLEGAGE